MNKILIVAFAVAVLSGALVRSYKLGGSHGYDQGWSDAQCGPDRDCEAGQN